LKDINEAIYKEVKSGWYCPGPNRLLRSLLATLFML